MKTNSKKTRPKSYELSEALALISKYKMSDEDAAELLKKTRSNPFGTLIGELNGGAPRRWHFVKLFFLWWDVQAIVRARPTITVSAACNTLSKRGWAPLKATTLRVTYEKEAKASGLVKMIKAAVAELGWEEIQSAVHGIDRSRLIADADSVFKKFGGYFRYQKSSNLRLKKL